MLSRERDAPHRRGRERVALNTAYVYALMRAGLVPLVVLPFSTRKRHAPRSTSARSRPVAGARTSSRAATGRRPPKLGETDRDRDAVEVASSRGAERRGLPILAICRGIQIFNVALGDAVPDLASERPGPSTTRMRARATGAGRVWYPAPPYTRDRASEREQPAPPGDLRRRSGAARDAWAEDGVIEGAERKDPGALGAGGPVASGGRCGGRAVPAALRTRSREHRVPVSPNG